MIKKLSGFVVLILISMISLTSCAQLQEIAQNLGGEAPLTEQEVVSGLKQALEIGAQRAAGEASQTGGFLENELLFIMFPAEARRVENTLRDIGLGSLVDDFVKTLNRSAEEAAKQAAPVFISAVQNMTIRDGFEILRGPDDAATTYLRSNTSDELTQLFRPVIQEAMDNTLATRYWNDITTQYNRIPFVQPVTTDLTAYTTERALDGLFLLLKEEEKAIRENPVKRTTDLLRRVFGHSSLAPSS